MTIRSRIIAYYIVTMVVGVALVTAVTVFPMLSGIASGAIGSLPVIATAAKSGIETVVARGWDASLSLTHSSVLKEWYLHEGDPAWKDVERLALADLYDLAATRGFSASFSANRFSWNFYVGNKKDGVNKVDVMSEKDPDDSWFFDALKSDRELLLNVDHNNELDTTMLWFNAQVRLDGKPIGIAGIGYDISAIIKAFQESVPTPNSRLFLVDPSGKIVIDAKETDTGKAISEVLGGDLGIAAEDESVKIAVIDGVRHFVFHSEVLDSGFEVALVGPESDFVPSLLQSAGHSFLVAIVWILVVAVVSFLVIRHWFGPLPRLERALTDMAAEGGDLTKKLAVTDDEIGKVARPFNDFVDSLRETVAGIKEAMRKSLAVKEAIVGTTRDTGSAITEIDANIVSIGERIGSLDANMRESSRFIGKIFTNIEKLDGQIRDQAAMVEESTASIHEMKASLANLADISVQRKQSVGSLADSARESANRLDETEKLFSQEITNRMRGIVEMNEVVSKVAAQTNLLAMNAAIEAAHAGDAGKGFAVVADEIRKLSEATAESARNISNAIKEISRGVERTGEGVKETAETFGKIEREVEEVVKTFDEMMAALRESSIGADEIMQAMQKLNDLTAIVSGEAKEISGAGKQLRDSSEGISGSASEASAGMSEIAKGVGEIRKSIENLRVMDGELEAAFGAVAEETGRFKTE